MQRFAMQRFAYVFYIFALFSFPIDTHAANAPLIMGGNAAEGSACSQSGAIQINNETQMVCNGSNWVLVSQVTSVGKVGVKTSSPESALHIPDGEYLQFADHHFGGPPAGDCDSDAERGRLSIDTLLNFLYICNGAARGWDHVLMLP
jgi:hypothetical protein